jgi:outer membrane lipoprotein-sorting protein
VAVANHLAEAVCFGASESVSHFSTRFVVKHIRGGLLAFGLILAAPVAARADDSADARAIVDKAIKAQGGDKLAKIKGVTTKMKGTVHVMGLDIPFTGEVVAHGPDQLKLDLEAEAGGQKFRIVNVINGDKGWTRMGETTTELDKDKLAEAREGTHKGWVATLVPLKDKKFTLATIGEVMVEKRPALGVKVSYKGRRDIDLYFDKETHLLVKVETQVLDEGSGKELLEETFYTDYKDVQGTKQAMKFSIKRDGKAFLEAEASDHELAEKIEASVFDKP